jgi:hypothetical protein
MQTAGSWSDVALDYGVLEIDEALTAHGPQLELHVLWTESEGLIAWWRVPAGVLLRWAEVGLA